MTGPLRVPGPALMAMYAGFGRLLAVMFQVGVEKERFMGRSTRQVIGSLAVLALLGLSSGARAQTTVNLTMTSSTGLTSSIGGWTITFDTLTNSSCQFYIATGTGNTTAPNCTGIDMVESVVGRDLHLTFQGHGGTALESAVGSGGSYPANYSDLLLNFTVTPAGGKNVKGVTLGINGSATLSGGGADTNPTDLAKISGGEQGYDSGFTQVFNITTNSSSNPALVSSAFATAVTPLSVSKDLKVNGYGATAGATLTLNYVTQTFAPEPISLSLFGVGLAGLAALRRRYRR